MFIINKLKVFEGFSGVGAVSMSIEKLKIPHELVGISEVDVDAIISFGAIHYKGDIEDFIYPSIEEMQEYLIERNIGYDFQKKKSKIKHLRLDKLKQVYMYSVLLKNKGDINLIKNEEMEDADLYTFGSPCQDFSVAGKQKGSTWICKDCGYEYNPLDIHWSKRDVCPSCNNKNIDKSRSSLVVESLRIIRHKKFKYLLMENVKNLVGKQFKPSFDKIIAELNEYGYNTYWDVLNSKYYGVPQNRQRVIVISIRKDIDTVGYAFPKGFDNGVRLKDILEEQVAEKYYLNKALNPVFTDNYIQYDNSGKSYNSQASRLYYTDSLMGSLPHSNGGDKTQIICADKKELLIKSEEAMVPSPELVGGIGEINFGKQYRQGNRVYSSEKTAMCLLSQPVGNTGGYSYLYAVSAEEDTNKLIKLQDGSQGNRVYSTEGLSPTISAGENGGEKRPGGLFNDNFKIRRLTPKECWRLMGFDDTDFYKAQSAGISDTQLYKQAGNSIVVNVLEYIFKNLFKDYIVHINNI